MTTLETPSGKGAGDENFPVASRLVAAEHRPDIMAFYDFVRAADDIADSGALTSEEKLQRLDMFERALGGDAALLATLPKAAALRRALDRSGVSRRHALDVLKAFRQDAIKTRYDSFQDLLGYCAYSAAPVGRYLLDLHGEDTALYRYADPLCAALQILNHLQDCADDLATLNRLYLPGDMMAAAGIDDTALQAPQADAGLRHVLDGLLDRTALLLAEAETLPGALASRRLGAESAVILEMAKTLLAALRKRDPLAERVELSKPAFLLAAIKGLLRLHWLKRSHGVSNNASIEAGS